MGSSTTPRTFISFCSIALSAFSKILEPKSDWLKKKLPIMENKLSQHSNICIIKALFTGILNHKTSWLIKGLSNSVISDGPLMHPPSNFIVIQQKTNFLWNCWLCPSWNCVRKSIWLKSWYLGTRSVALWISSWKSSLLNKAWKHYLLKDSEQWMSFSKSLFKGFKVSSWKNIG